MFDNLPLEKARHLLNLFAALFMSDHWHNSWLEHKKSRILRMRRFAIWCKARSIVNYDRVLCGDKRLISEEL